MESLPGSAGPAPPTADQLASVVASVIGSSRTADDIRDHSGVSGDQVGAAITYLREREVIREVASGHYHVSQSLCAGTCSRGGRAVRGEDVVINMQTLGWMCADCRYSRPANGYRGATPSGDLED